MPKTDTMQLNRRINLLIVDDNPGDIDLITAMLEGSHCFGSISSASNLKDSIEFCNNNQVDVVLLDLSLPDSLGVDTFIDFNKIHPSIAVIILTGLDDELMAMRTLNLGAQDYLVKGKDLANNVIRAITYAKERKEIQEAYKKEAKMNSMLLESIMDGFFSLDKDLKITYFNQAAERLLNTKKEDIIGKIMFKEVFTEAKGSRFEKEYRSALETKKANKFEFYFDVEPFQNWYEVRISPLDDGISVFFQVTTNIKKEQEELASTKAVLQTALDNSQAGIAIADASERKITYINKAGLILHGRKDKELTKDIRLNQYIKNWNIYDIDGSPLNEDEIPLTKALLTGKKCSREFIIKKDKSKQHLVLANAAPIKDENGKLKAAMVIFLDITETKKAQGELELLSSAIEQTGDMILITSKNGEILYVNAAFEKVTGYDAEEVIGKNPKILKSGEQNDAFYEDLWKTISGGAIWKGELVNKKKDGSFYTENATISPVFNQKREVISYVAVKTDITEKVSLKKHNKQLENQYLQAQKMQSIGRLAGGIAHDFNNMLCIIMGNAELMLNLLKESDPLFKRVNQIIEAGKKSTALTQQLLIFSRKKPMKKQIININELVKSMDKMLRRLITDNIEMIEELSVETPTIKSDQILIEQLLMNLVVNSRDAMPDGGEILIKSEIIYLEKEMLTAEEVSGKFVVLSVADTGTGMDEETQSHIFEPFYSTKAEGKGTGLGLSTVYGIVKQSKGYITVNSELGKGSQFKVYLPFSDDKIEKNNSTEEKQEHAGDNELILLVEDDSALRDLLGEILTSRFNYSVKVASNGRDALDLIEKESLKPDLLVTDMFMPEVSGLELYNILKEKEPDMKVLFMSGYSEEAEKIVQDVPFIQKPFSMDKLSEMIKTIID